ncbi:helix-turn-helix domain-containing protein [Coraliomargarita algicola]|uniref:Helix-turn-helix domain-containing protein n=1 Tax=Coraliomargarita algicola TaxID=3092156 RepID=A0ABZ0RR13_9BACT|nr:helix-turn-helix domain-containing protein [Coraliomargarita sp. J2-16]WPJ97538.1 helix-turn-helix domain-containing protein [Coraliomargarita sp. J2-16]
MRVEQDTTMEAAEESHWADLKLSLQRFWEGEPIGQVGQFTGVVLTVWKLKAGELTLSKGNCVEHAQAGDWIVCHPGKRHQAFSDSARLLSLHLQVECPAGAARWVGNPVVVFEHDAELDRLLHRLRRTSLLKHLSQQGRLHPEGELTTLEDILELKECLTAFFRRLVQLLRPLGMRYEVASMQDARVRESYRRLNQVDLRDGFSREQLAQTVGVSASQLDRLWMRELEQTPKRFWNWRRLQAACALLQEDRQAKEVAYETGFDHLSQFSLWFRANMGESPSAFRTRQRGITP